MPRAVARAFTLVEMLLVLALIGLLAGSVVVSFEGRQKRYRLQTTAKDLAAAIRYAREEANVQGRAFRLVFEEGKKAYLIEAANGAGEYRPVRGRAGLRRPVSKQMAISLAASGDPWPSGLPEVLEFHPDGSGFHGSIVVRNRDNEAIEIQVVPTATQVHLLE